MTEHTAHESLPVLVGLTCDRCGTRHDDVVERQEFLRWKDTGGYGNMAFGDGSRLELDLCQYCIKQVLGAWVWVDGRRTPAESSSIGSSEAEDGLPKMKKQPEVKP